MGYDGPTELHQKIGRVLAARRTGSGDAKEKL